MLVRPPPCARSAKTGIAVFFLCIVLSFSAIAASPDKLQKIEQELARQKERANALAETEKTTAQNLSALQQKLVASTAALQDKQEEQEKLEDQLARLEKESVLRSAALEDGRKRLTELTSALLRLSRLPPEAFLLHEEQTTDHEHRAILLRAILPRLQAETENVARDLSGLEALRRKTIEQKKLLDATRQNLEAQRVNLDAMVKARQGLLQKTTEERSAMADKMAALTAEAQNLRQLLDKVSQPVWPKQPPIRLQAGIKPPVAGRVIRDYGEKDGYGVASDGLTYVAAAQSPVVAPQDGRIVFAGPFRGYGKIIIIDHGDGYHSFLAGLGRIDTDVGQTVAAGEPIGLMSNADNDSSELYFEWRHNGDPTNPAVKTRKVRR